MFHVIKIDVAGQGSKKEHGVGNSFLGSTSQFSPLEILRPAPY